MSMKKKRIYNSKSRGAKAALTRTRILSSASKLLMSEGFEAVTIEKLAQAANVSAPTIYALFQSKRGILRALMDEALPNDRREALVEPAMQAKSAYDLFGITAKISRQLYDAERSQMDAFRGASVLGPEFKELEKEREQRRYQRLEETINMIAREKSIAEGLSVSKAHDILWAFTGRDMYRMFVIEQGWTSDEYEQWLAQLLVKTLMKDEG